MPPPNNPDTSLMWATATALLVAMILPVQAFITTIPPSAAPARLRGDHRSSSHSTMRATTSFPRLQAGDCGRCSMCVSARRHQLNSNNLFRGSGGGAAIVGRVATQGRALISLRMGGSRGNSRNASPLMMSSEASEPEAGYGDQEPEEGEGEPDLTMASVREALRGKEKAKAEEDNEEDGYDDDDDEYDEDDIDSRLAAARARDPFYKPQEPDPDAGKYEEIVANMTKPLGITIEASTDEAELVYITSVGEQAAKQGLSVGDVVTGVSAVFGGNIWSVKGETVEKIRSLVRCRTEPYTLVKVERGHVTLEERCREGFGVEDEDGLAFCTIEEDDDLDVVRIWDDVYREEAEVFKQGSGIPAVTPEEEALRRISRRDIPTGGFADRDWGESGSSDYGV